MSKKKNNSYYQTLLKTADERINSQYNLIATLSAILTIVIGLFGLFSYFSYSELNAHKKEMSNLQENFETYIETRLQETIQKKDEEFTILSFHNYLHKGFFLNDQNGDRFHTVKGNKPLPEKSFQEIISYLKNKNIFSHNIKNNLDENKKIFIAITRMLSWHEKDERIDYFFSNIPNDILYSNLETSLTVSPPVYYLMPYYTQDYDFYEKNIIQLLEYSFTKDSFHTTCSFLNPTKASEELLSWILRCVEASPGDLLRLKDNKIIIDYLFKNSDNVDSLFELSLKQHFRNPNHSGWLYIPISKNQEKFPAITIEDSSYLGKKILDLFPE